MPLAQLLAMSEGAGGLFDFNATLPLMAIMFVLLTVVLTYVFYKPVGQLLESRKTLISGNLAAASERLLKADKLHQQYSEQLKDARKNAQDIILEAEKGAHETVAEELGHARKDIAAENASKIKKIEEQEDSIANELETKSDEIVGLIILKIINPSPQG